MSKMRLLQVNMTMGVANIATTPMLTSTVSAGCLPNYFLDT